MTSLMSLWFLFDEVRMQPQSLSSFSGTLKDPNVIGILDLRRGCDSGASLTDGQYSYPVWTAASALLDNRPTDLAHHFVVLVRV